MPSRVYGIALDVENLKMPLWFLSENGWVPVVGKRVPEHIFNVPAEERPIVVAVVEDLPAEFIHFVDMVDDELDSSLSFRLQKLMIAFMEIGQSLLK